MSQPQLWVLAGGNGAGKSTFYRLYLQARGLPFVNADQLAKLMHPEDVAQGSYDAAKAAAIIRSHFIRNRKSFCFETVFSHPSKIDVLSEAKAAGYEITLVVIHLENSELNQARVAQRVSEGGHDVPPEKVASRIPRTLANLKIALPLCDQVSVYDNSLYTLPFREIFTIEAGQFSTSQSPLPAWAAVLAEDYL